MPISFNSACYSIEGEMTGRSHFLLWTGKVASKAWLRKAIILAFCADNPGLLCWNIHSQWRAGLFNLSILWCTYHVCGTLGWMDELFIVRRDLTWDFICHRSCLVAPRLNKAMRSGSWVLLTQSWKTSQEALLWAHLITWPLQWLYI